MSKTAILFLIPCLAFGQEPGVLRVVVTAGEGAFNDIRHKTGRSPAVQVRDVEDNPVAGARVVFALPEGGPSGTFASGGRTYETTTDAQGRAATPALRPNPIEGRFNIKVSCTDGSRHGAAIVSQSNTLAGGVTEHGKGGGKGKLILLGLAAGAGAGIVLGTRGRGAPAPAPVPPTVLSIGSVTVGGPK